MTCILCLKCISVKGEIRHCQFWPWSECSAEWDGGQFENFICQPNFFHALTIVKEYQVPRKEFVRRGKESLNIKNDFFSHI